MAENTTETIIGAAVVAVAVGFLAFVGNSAGVSGASGSYPLKASFRSVEGVSVGTDVRLAGVKIGTITNLELNPLTYRAVATFSIKEGLEFSDDTQVLISSEGLLGGNFVEIVPGGGPGNLAAGDEILDTQGAISLTTLLLKFVTGSEE